MTGIILHVSLYPLIAYASAYSLYAVILLDIPSIFNQAGVHCIVLQLARTDNEEKLFHVTLLFFTQRQCRHDKKIPGNAQSALPLPVYLL